MRQSLENNAQRNGDNLVEKMLQKLSAELVQKEAELLHEHVHCRHVALAKQEVGERERVLCRRVGVAVILISFLWGHLQESGAAVE